MTTAGRAIDGVEASLGKSKTDIKELGKKVDDVDKKVSEVDQKVEKSKNKLAGVLLAVGGFMGLIQILYYMGIFALIL